jgi:hypothetical protein
MLMPPDAAYSVWWFWRGHHGSFSASYINLEAPVARWSDGRLAGLIPWTDLDIVAAPDRTWRWKDEDELAERRAHPAH